MTAVAIILKTMLYLPALQADDCDVRIPCSTVDLLALCTNYAEFESVESVAEQILTQNPGVLIYSLSRFQRASGTPAGDFGELVRWMDLEFFGEAIGYHAFEPAPHTDLVQQNLLVKWLRRPSKKRASRFVECISELNRRQASDFVEQIWCDSFELPKSIEPGAALMPSNNSEHLPIRHFWNVCGKLQRLQTNFRSDLLRSKLMAMKQLAYGASHEINNPLANIATRAQSLLTEETNASKRQRLAVIYEQAMRAHEMISDMMLFAEPPDISYQSVEVKPLVEQVVSELRSELEGRDIIVGIRQYPDVENCELDSTQFAEAIKALIVNSIQAIGSGGEIRVQIWKPDDGVIGICVADNGCGIEDDAVEQIFDPFYSGREAGRGLGFGLSKVWRIVELHGGEVKFESDENWASRFTIRIPRERLISEPPNFSRIDNAYAA